MCMEFGLSVLLLNIVICGGLIRINSYIKLYFAIKPKYIMQIPGEIESLILSFLHPYYILQYNLTCKRAYLIKDTLNKNQLLLQYCYTNSETFPTIQLKDIVELSLIYDPIPESSRYYESTHCLYEACRRKQVDITPFIHKSVSKITPWIYWKFGYHNELKNFFIYSGNKDIFVSQLLYSLYNIYPEVRDHYVYGLVSSNYDWEIIMQHIPEFITPIEKVKLYLSSIKLGWNGQNTRVFLHLLEIISKADDSEFDQVQILIKDMIDLDITIERRLVQGVAIHPKLKLIVKHLQPQYADMIDHIETSIITPKHRGVHYLSAGRYIDYMKWKLQGHEFKYGEENSWSGKHIHIWKLSYGILAVGSKSNECNCQASISKLKKDINLNTDDRLFLQLSKSSLGISCYNSKLLEVTLVSGNKIILEGNMITDCCSE